jgi:hypothetical protein
MALCCLCTQGLLTLTLLKPYACCGPADSVEEGPFTLLLPLLSPNGSAVEEGSSETQVFVQQLLLPETYRSVGAKPGDNLACSTLLKARSPSASRCSYAHQAACLPYRCLPYHCGDRVFLQVTSAKLLIGVFSWAVLHFQGLTALNLPV